MDARFGPEARAVMREAWRREHLDPEAFWAAEGLRPGDVVADVGAGSGYFALPAARRVGPAGRVLAFDVSPLAIRQLARAATAEGLPWLEARASGEHALPAPDAVADVALVAFTIHEVVDGARLLAEVARVLKPGGRLVLVDWTSDHAGGPAWRYAPHAVAHLARRAGFDPTPVRPLNVATWRIEARRPGPGSPPPDGPAPAA